MHAGHPSRSYTLAGDLLSKIAREIRSEGTPLCGTLKSQSDCRLLTIDAFRANPKYGGDGNRIDLAYAVYGITHGVNERAVAAAINSRDLSKKGSPNRQYAYISRTITKAIEYVGKAGGR
jgi:hypothetical protein